MSEYKKHSISEIETSILDRITEDEIVAWMIARMHNLKTESFPISNLELEVWHRNYRGDEHYDSRFSFYVAGEHGYGQTIAIGVREVREKIAGNPQSKAAEKRREAAAATREAEKLEALARTLG